MPTQLSPSLQSSAPTLNSVTDPGVMLTFVRLCHKLFIKAAVRVVVCTVWFHAVAKLDKYDGATVTFMVVEFNTNGSMSLRESLQVGKLHHAKAQP